LFDVDFCWRASYLGIEPTFVPDACVQVRFREGPEATYRQAANWARVEPELYRRHKQHGMPGSSIREAVKGWARIAIRAPRRRQNAYSTFYYREVGRRLGRLNGSLAARVLYL